MMMPRIIGHQAKSAKHSTAPMRNACPVRLSRSLRPRLDNPRTGEAGARPCGSLVVPGTVMIAIATLLDEPELTEGDGDRRWEAWGRSTVGTDPTPRITRCWPGSG